jgi:hypothetical protein
MKGASARASNGNSVAPSRIRNFNAAATTAAIGAATSARTVKPVVRSRGAQPDDHCRKRERDVS